MLTLKTVIENIENGASMSDIIEYISSWIEETRTLADTIGTVFFSNGLPEPEKEDAKEFFKRAVSSYYALEMALDWIQNAVDAAGAHIFRKEQEERVKLAADEQMEQAAGREDISEGAKDSARTADVSISGR